MKLIHPTNNNCQYLTLYYFLVQLYFQVVLCISPLWDSVTTNIHQEYDVQEGRDILTVRINMGEYKSTDLVVGEDIRRDGRLIFTCIAHHGPAQWIYSGDGSPNFLTNTSIENVSASGKRLPVGDMNGAKRYVATLILGQKGITTKDTGRYNCMTASPDEEMNYKTLSAFYHLYVPAMNKLFTRKSETIYYDLNKSAARIPCGVSNPKASVTLQKFAGGKLEFLASESMLYHPISGFYPKEDIQGTYLCTAAIDDTFDFVHFKLLPISSADLAFNNHGKSSNKKPSRIKKPEDLEWLMYPSWTTKSPQTTPTTQSFTSTYSSKPIKKKSNQSSYIPFHLRYTTTYGPFQTFFDVHTTPSTMTRPTAKPFNPQDVLEDTRKTVLKVSNDPSASQSDLFIPEELISYRPFVSPSTKTPNYSASHVNNRWPASSVGVERTSTAPTTRARTTPRKYKPYSMPTTEFPIEIPESVICSQFNCGINAICVASMVHNPNQKSVNSEPSCVCLPDFRLGNPYLECYAPTTVMDPNVLHFNLSSFSSFARTPILTVDSESESNSEINEDSVDEENDRKTTIIDM